MVKETTIKNNNKTPAFSLLEACVTMLIVGIFTALCANAFTKRHITYQEADGHGRFECYYASSGAATVTQFYVENNSARPVASTGTSCTFRPPRYAKYLLINMVGGGSGTAAGEFKSIFYTSLAEPLTLIPGKQNRATTIKMNGSQLYSVAAGTGTLVATSSAASTVDSCTFSYTAHNCGSTPICAQSGTNLSISYCRSDTEFVNTRIPISDIKEYRTSYSGDTLVYRDLSEYEAHSISPENARTMVGNGAYETNYTVNVKFRVTSNTQSQMGSYMEALGLPADENMRSANPGSRNTPGGVLIVW